MSSLSRERARRELMETDEEFFRRTGRRRGSNKVYDTFYKSIDYTEKPYVGRGKGETIEMSGGGMARGMGAATQGGKFTRNG